MTRASFIAILAGLILWACLRECAPTGRLYILLAVLATVAGAMIARWKHAR